MHDIGQIGAGEVFCGRYRVERLLKAGGMGAVYVAEHTATRKKVALKLMHPEIVASAEARARFAQEAQASGIIESANIVDVYDAGVDPETQVPFIAMELLAGSELGELVRERGRIPAGDVADYILQTARALDRAHAAGVIHRDLKPDNLFLAIRDGELPRVKILDFGIAKFLAGQAAETTRATGTPRYMAPEQTRKGAAIGPQTDIWALGLIAYTLLVGRPYWEGDDIHEIFGEIFGGDYEPPSVRALRSGVALPAAFDAWFFRCVDPDPSRRFTRAGEAGAKLAEALRVAPPSLDRTPLSLADAATIAMPVTLGEPPGPLDLPPPASVPASSTTASGAMAASTSPVSTTQAPSRARLLGVGALVVTLAAGATVLGVSWARGRGTHAVAALSLGNSDATCVLGHKGLIHCVGAYLDRKGTAAHLEPLELKGHAVELALGKHHGCARMTDGSVHCWGQNGDGQLGDGTTRSHAPAEVPGLRSVAQITSSTHGSCARLTAGPVECWGGNKYGQVGDGTTTDRLAPVYVEGARDATEIAQGQDHTCALFADGTVRCWGRNADGELGDDTGVDRPTPAVVPGLRNVVAVSLGGHYGCALVRDGTVRCWGSNADGELGDGTTAPSRRTPAPVAGLSEVAQISAGWRHACARLSSGVVRCWGQNTFGQIGDGTTTTRPVPVTLAGTFTHLAAGRTHTCGTRDDGATVCWGRNELGQLGDGTTTNRLEAVPVKW